MRTEFRASFVRDLDAIRDANLLGRIRAAVEGVEQAATLQAIPNLTKLQGRGDYYRLRVGDYRLGLEIENDLVIFVRCLNRSDIYRHFP